MENTSFALNREQLELSVDKTTPLLWVLRDHLGLTGTKFGCGKGLCGACTVHLNGVAIRSCSVALGSIKDQKITTIEGIGNHPKFQELKRAWIEGNVPQCGYCQPGQLMNATALLTASPDLDKEAVRFGMSGNICRCGTYQRILDAIETVKNKEGNHE
ncbi:(2Fe-2S)-binding protein [bacterium]|nr:(2Fe-2S)-binding protein [bacterium]